MAVLKPRQGVALAAVLVLLYWNIWFAATAFFLWLAVRELRSDGSRGDGGFYLPYFLSVIALAGACIWPPLSNWRFESKMASVATRLADSRRAQFHCNTVVDMIFSPAQLNPGYTRLETGEIRFQKNACSDMRRYLRAPQEADLNALNALNLITHEAMHVRGEMREPVTECQAVQRNYRAAVLLGVPEPTARRNAADIYLKLYPRRNGTGYFSVDCAPGKALDEHLNDSIWVVMAEDQAAGK